MENSYEKHFTIQIMNVDGNHTLTNVENNMDGLELFKAVLNLMEISDSYALVFLSACEEYREKNKAGF